MSFTVKRVLISITNIFPFAPKLNINKKGLGTARILYTATGGVRSSACKCVLRGNKYKHISRVGDLRVYVPDMF